MRDKREDRSVYSLGYIADQIGGEVKGNSERQIRCMSPLDGGGKDCLIFVRDQKHYEKLESPKTGALVLDFQPDKAEGMDYILIKPEDKDGVFIKLLSLFEDEKDFGTGVSERARVSAGAQLGDGVVVDDFAVIGEDVSIGDNTCIGAHTVIGRNCRIGKGSVIYPRVTIYPHTHIEDNVIIHSGVVIGCDGFGYTRMDGAHRKIPQIGGVYIERDVEVGANTTIDRATLGHTRIGAGTKIDNLVQIAHNVEIGKNCIICGLCGISGSVTIGNNVVLAGQVGLADHIVIEDDVYVLAKSGIMEKVVKRGRVVLGAPAMDVKKTMEYFAMIPKLRGMHRDIQKIKKKLHLDDEKS
jgi:UDP-3-O-[3-hydroxymyristoyl] glucosamine N-acyltransferase